MAWPWCFRSFLLTSNIVVFLFFQFFIITTDSARELANFSQNPRKAPCIVSNLGREVYCKLDSWSTELKALPWPRSRVRHLHIDILRQDSVLTVDHLSGFSSLRSLIIRGRCADPIHSRKGTAMDICHQMRGLVAIQRRAFIGTPHLQRLYLHSHPMPVLNNLQQLRRLRHLHIKQAFALRLIEKDSLVRSLVTLSVLQNNISVIRSSMFQGLNQLQQLSWTFINPNLVLKTEAIANLPRLASIWLYCVANCRSNRITFSRYSISNLPSLEAVSLRRLILVGIQDDANICYLPNVSIQHLYYDSTDSAILKLCYDLWRCEKCGREPNTYPQTVILRNIWEKFFNNVGDPGSNRRLKSVLPPPNKIRQLNVSVFYSDGSQFTDIQDELARFPLIKSFHFHSPEPGTRFLPIRSTFRLKNNPLAFLPHPERVTSVRFAIRFCDCYVTEMILWARRNMPSRSGDKSVLKLACLNMQCSCFPGNAKGRIMNEPNQWLGLSFILRRLEPYCAPNSLFLGRQIPDKLCTINKHCPAYGEDPGEFQNDKKMTVVIRRSDSNSAVHLKHDYLSVFSILFSIFFTSFMPSNAAG